MNRTQKRAAAKRDRQAGDGRDAAELLHQQGLAAYRVGRHAEAAELIGRAIKSGGGNSDYHCNLGVVLRAGGRPDAALGQFERAIALNARHVLALGNRGNLLVQMGRLAEAAASYRAALAVAPQNPGIENNLGNVLRQLGKPDAAISAYQRAVALAPDYVEALGNLGSMLVATGQLDAATGHLERALVLRPGDAPAHANLGSALSRQREYRRAEEHYRAAVAASPNLAPAHAGLGDVLTHQGRLSEAARSYEEALRLAPNEPAALSALLFLRNYSSDTSAVEMAAIARSYGEVVSRGVVRPERYANPPDPERRLRIGLVSGDLRTHAVSSFLGNVLPALHTELLELFAYATSPVRDARTDELAKWIGHWRDAALLEDEHLSAIIAQDGIDVLVDLSGHTMFNRLPVFARKPAPVQVTWLGYSGTTGLETIDYILGDRWVTPQAEAADLTEIPWQMPASYLCFSPPGVPIEVGPLPAGRDGPITFGSFNNLNKLSDTSVAAWSQVLGAVPGSRLLLKHRALGEPEIAAKTRERFAAHGIAAERLLLQGRDPSAAAHFDNYNRVDIGLDPFPYNGTTTTVEALWMGVPVLGLKGDRFIAHVGESILNTVGLEDWVADDIESYVAKAAAFATDRGALAELRQKLRPQFLASPLCDAPRFARDLEAAFRSMWRRWCAGQGPETPAGDAHGNGAQPFGVSSKGHGAPR